MVRPKGTKKIEEITYLHLKLERDLKEKIDNKARSLGMSLSSFIRSTLIGVLDK